MEMGFDSSQAQEALTVCNGDMERAVGYLFAEPSSSSDPPAFATASISSSNSQQQHHYQDVVASISQYSLDQGRSACTCIALTAAHKFLTSSTVSAVTPHWLESSITEGVATYQKLQNQSSSVEHMSAEEVLGLAATFSSQEAPCFSKLQLTPGGIRQGILSNTPSNSEMGLFPLLTACHQEAPRDKWLAVLITKTPETVLACLPPTSTTATTNSYMIIDSHPRPGVVSSNGAYARIVPSLHDLIHHLETILPATELGPDIPEMMAMMYNSFDLYPLILKS